MGKITFYCNVCAGPLSDWELLKRSMLQPGEDELGTFDDDCECEYDGEAANDQEGEGNEEGDYDENAEELEVEGEKGGGEDEIPEPNSEEDLARHDSYCSYRRGYRSDILLQKDIQWLSEACMVRMRGSEHDEDADAPHPEGIPIGECYLTPTGSYDPYDGLIISGTDQEYYPNRDGFMVHATCWDMLHMVSTTRNPENARLDRRSLNDIFLDWGDERMYGGTEEFAEQEWVPVPGYEWLVADPTKHGDLSELVRDANNMKQRKKSLDGYTPSVVFDDPFARLPTEVHHMILELLPSQSVLNLFLSSRIFRLAGTNLPPVFWKSRISIDAPWANVPSLHEIILEKAGKVDYKALLVLLKNASSALADGSNPRYGTWLSLMNRRRIWTCCEGILDAMEVGRKESGYVSRELEALTSSRIARIRKPGIREIGKLVDNETYFRPRTLDQPHIRGLTVYFSDQTAIVGIEWHLEGESSGRLFGNRGVGMQSVALRPGLVITGILLSLGEASSPGKDQAIRGLGLLSADDDYRPCVKLGRWTDDDIVHVFRPAKTQPDATIVGIAGQYSKSAITKFGILTADVISKTPAIFTPVVSNIDIYTRWHTKYIPPPNKDLQLHTRYGIKGFPLGDLSPFDPPILENPGQYIDLRNRQIASIQTFYPLGEKKEFGGFRIDFADRSHEIVHKEETDPEYKYPKEVVTFDVEAKETITKLICYFDSNASRTTPSVLHGLEFITSKNRKLGLGWLDAYSEDYRRDAYIRRSEKVVGLHFGIKIPVIESIGLVVSSS
ncbi:hypothetical protein BJY01DRAFT_251265 [Aspergillus pseudoustus]|uniref:F-box domain-containing protein n=1 Tax=Aspergillus pseudoustus TaxID=1810923 RepID=A0ABR4JD15_9EURO